MNFPFYAQAPKETVTRCNLCESKSFQLQNTVDRYGLTAPVVECKACGLVFLSSRMTPIAYRLFYEGGHYRRLLSEFYGKPITAQSIEAEQEVYATRLSGWLNPYKAQLWGGLLLDIGGSTGVVADRLAKDFNLDATVVEPSEQEAQRARDKGLSVAPVPFEEYHAGGNHYDLITLCQTVDHLLDIKEAFQHIRSLLSPRGLFFVDFVEDGPIKIDHPFYLTRRTMREFLFQTGFVTRALAKSEDGLHVNILAESVQ